LEFVVLACYFAGADKHGLWSHYYVFGTINHAQFDWEDVAASLILQLALKLSLVGSTTTGRNKRSRRYQGHGDQLLRVQLQHHFLVNQIRSG
jgi:hypothetical protein